MKISVIIPIYNVEKYLVRCLESICNQTYKDLEIILINDGSSDRSFAIAQEYETRDNRIQLITQDNNGVSVARNKGLDVATGDYIAFVDPDDYIDPKAYEILKENIGDADLLICNYHNSINSVIYNLEAKTESIKELRDNEILDLLFDKEYTKSVIGVVIWNKLYKKELFNNIRFNKHFRRAQDEELIFRIYVKCKKIKIINQKLYYYFQRPDNKVRLMLNEKEQNDRNKLILSMYEDRLRLAENFQIYNHKLLFAFLNLLIEYYNYQKNKLEKKQIYSVYKTNLKKLISSNSYDRSKHGLKTLLRFYIFKISPYFYSLLIKYK